MRIVDESSFPTSNQSLVKTMQAEICMLREAGISTFKYKNKKYLEAGKLKQMTIDKGQDW